MAAQFEIRYEDGSRSVLGNVTATEAAKAVAKELRNHVDQPLRLFRVSEIDIDAPSSRSVVTEAEVS